MSALHILAVILLALLVIGQIRVGCRVEYSAEGLQGWAQLGPFQLQIFPLRPSTKKKKKAPSKNKQRAKKKQEPTEQKTAMQRLGGGLEYVYEFLPIVQDCAGIFYRRLRVDILTLELTVGADDPAEAALRYGQANSLLGALWQPLTQAFEVNDGTARAKIDFDATCTTIYAAAALSLKIGQMCWLGLYVSARGVKAFFVARGRNKNKQQQRKAA